MALPPSSPRLPSPPPPAEIQITPNSPLMGPNAARQAAQIEQTAIDTNAKRRIHPGTKSADMAAGPPLIPLHELDSAFQLQEHLAALHYYHTESHTTPINRETAKLLATPPPGIDKTLWLYELCRFLIAQCNSLIVGFLFDTPPCSAATCPEMRAGEWQFLCAVHDTPKSCCAIDYCCHTLDWAANVVTNPKIFPSRFLVDAHDKNTALKNLVNVFRRLHRIFAHAWFQHRGVFWSLESQSGLYVFFKTVCDVYDLLPAENYKLPPEAEGLDSNAGASDIPDRNADRRQQQQQSLAPITVAKPPSQRDAEDGDYSAMSRTNTRRHIKSSPSTGSAVTTVPEADEDDGSDLSHRLRQMRIAAARAEAEGEESASIPVIVEHRPVAAAEQPMRPSSVVPPPGTTASGSQPMSEQEPEPTKQEVEAPAPEHEFALEPEAPAQLPFRPKPVSEAEPVPEPQSGPEIKAEEEQPAAPVEYQHPPEEQPKPTAAATTEEEPGPEPKEAEAKTQEAPSTAAAEEASEEDSASSSPVAENADETGADAKVSDTAEEKEVKDAKKEEETEEEKTEESGEPTAQEAEAPGPQGAAEQEKEKETEAKTEPEPETEAESTKEDAEVASPPEKEAEVAEEGAEKETEKKEDGEEATKEEEKVEEKEEETAPKEEGADTKEEAAPKEKQDDDKAEEGKKTADEEKKSD